MSQGPEIITWLRAAGEPTRLRLLALCAERDLSVSDLAHAVGQSEPRVSRHLKILSDAGLIERVRQGQWVHYRLSTRADTLVFVRSILGQLDTADTFFAKDRERLEAATRARHRASAAESRLGRALRAFVESSRVTASVSSALVIGAEHLDLIQAVARLASRCVAIAHTRRSAQAARAFVDREGIACRVLQTTSGDVCGARDLTRAGAPFEAIVLDRFTTSAGALAEALPLVREALSSNGRLWLFERYEALEGSRELVVEHPLARIRRLLRDAGFHCERLSPIEADGEHVLAAFAVPASATVAGVA